MKLFTSICKGLIVALILGATGLSAQNNVNTIFFKSGEYTPVSNVDRLNAENSFSNQELVNGNYYRIIHFSKIPSNAVKEALAGKGIVLQNYLPKNAYLAQINSSADYTNLKQLGINAIFPISAKFKLSKKLINKDYQDWALNGSKIKLNALFFDGLSPEYVRSTISKHGVNVILTNHSNTVRIEASLNQLSNIYNLPFLYYFEQIDAPSQPENLVGVTNHRSNNLATSYSSGLQYDGTGITVMLQDNSMLDDHIDYTGRFTDHPSASQSGDHGEHCGGTIAGAGNLDPTTRGMAYGADVINYDWDNNNYNDVPSLYTNDNVTITSKSYSNGVNAGYTTLARQLDQQTRQMPSLIHVFSAGNSNGSGSTSAGSQWFNVTGGHKAGKNVVTVANLTSEDVINSSSSRGPCEDGRIKPDISAVGTSVISTIDPNTYGSKTGTSMSCPGVSGTIAQLYHAYKDLNSGNNPPSGLIKAAILNTADEVGNPGPDFIHGWGRINGRRAFDVISNNNYLSASISNGGSNSHNINVPAGTDQVRIMVLWMDYEGAASASPALVNDINMSVTDPNTTNYNPWVLNPAPNATTLNQPAVRGVDNLNNMEQVTIDNPTAGTHTVNVSGFSIPQGPQTYYLVYEFVTDEVVLTYPIGGEGFDPSVDEKIRWDAYGNSGTFTLEYSTNNGSTWSNIASGINASQRYYDWNVPNVVTGQALVRVTRGASTSQSHQAFSIIRVPTGLNVNRACPDSMEVTWNAVSGATGYEVSVLGNKYMDSVGTAIGTNSLVIYAPSNTDRWWSVKALGPNNCVGRRANAVYQSSGVFNCILPVDAAISNLAPGNGFQLTSCMSGASTVSISVTNNGQSPLSNIPVHYIFNGGTPVNEVVPGPIGVGATVSYVFAASISPNAGANTLSVWNSLSSDGNSYNDSLYAQFTYSNAAPQSIPWTENFETFANCGTDSDCGATICNLTNGCVNETSGAADDIDWRVDLNGTPSQNTGPSIDFDPGINVGKYLYTEASGGCEGQVASLVTPCIDLTNATAAALSFGYNMYGVEMGELHVDIFANGVWTNDITAVISGNQGTNWQQRLEPLTPYLGSVVNFRFRGITGNGYRSDMAIDGISVTGTVGDQEITDAFSNVILYPNPAKHELNLTGLNGYDQVNIQVFNAVGQLVVEQNQLNGNALITMGIKDLTKGVYLVKVLAGGQIITKRFIKE